MSVYNAQNFLKTAIRSIRKQTLKEIELICVDDGSTDHSVEIIQEQMKNDKRIFVNTKVYLNTAMLPDKEVFSKEDIPGRIFAFASNVPWNKLFKKEFVQNNHLQFQPLKQANDTYFTLMAMFLAERITTVKEELLYYRVGNEASLTGKGICCVVIKRLNREIHEFPHWLRRMKNLRKESSI